MCVKVSFFKNEEFVFSFPDRSRYTEEKEEKIGQVRKKREKEQVRKKKESERGKKCDL